MSYGVRRKFYNSKAWEDVRRTIWLRQNLLCYYCNKPCYVSGISEYKPKGYRRIGIVHHKEHLTDTNIDDINISLNPDNLIGVCKQCHETICHNHSLGTRKEYNFDNEGNLIRV